MSYDNLSDFIAELQDDGELVRVAAEVDLECELAEIVDRLCKQPGGGPAVFFENVTGHTVPVVANLLCPMGRAAQPEEIAACCLFFASDESSYCNGAALEADGGSDHRIPLRSR